MIQERAAQPAMEYVVGYCFRPDFGAVALIEKLKPAWQAGKLNGVGGKIERGESAHDAMVREFAEEAGPTLHEWLHIRTEQFFGWQEAKRAQPAGAKVYHFAHVSTSAEWAQIRTCTGEKILKVDYPISRMGLSMLIYNLPYLIPMAAILLQQPPENRPAP